MAAQDQLQSPYLLLQQLVRTIVPSDQPWRKTLSQTQRKAFAKTYEILLGDCDELFDPSSCPRDEDGWLFRNALGVSETALVHRQARSFDRANVLELLLSRTAQTRRLLASHREPSGRLVWRDRDVDHQTPTRIVTLLLSLKKSSGQWNDLGRTSKTLLKELYRSSSRPTDGIVSRDSSQPVLPALNDPVVHRDTLCPMPRAKSTLYPESSMQRPKDVIQDRTNQNSIFTHLPRKVGRDVGDGLGVTSDPTLFGGLVHNEVPEIQPNRHRTVTIDLSIPRLDRMDPPTHSLLAAVRESEQLKATGIAPERTSADVSPTEQCDNEGPDVWQQAVAAKPLPRRDWDTLILPCKLTTPIPPHLLSEGGVESFDKVYQSHFPFEAVWVTEDELIKASLELLQGIPSFIFPFNEETDNFELEKSLRLKSSGVSSLRSMTKELLEAGTAFRRLEAFVTYFLEDSQRGGLVGVAFALELSSLLQRYRTCSDAFLLTQTQTGEGRSTQVQTMLSLVLRVRRIVAQLKYLTRLCLCDQNRSFQTDFPRGGALLTDLYNRLESGEKQRPILRQLLCRSIQPYLHMIEAWVYRGSCDDVHNEFCLVVLPDTTLDDPSHRWMNRFCLRPKTTVPKFLSKAVQMMISCARVLNIVRNRDPDHVLIKCIKGKLKLKFENSAVRRLSVGYTRSFAQTRKAVLSATKKGEEAEDQPRALSVAEEVALVLQQQKDNDLALSMRMRATRNQHRLDLLDQMAEKEKARRQDEERSAALDLEMVLTSQREAEIVEDAKAKLRAEYAKKAAEEEMRLARMSWQARRLALAPKRRRYILETLVTPASLYSEHAKAGEEGAHNQIQLAATSEATDESPKKQSGTPPEVDVVEKSDKSAEAIGEEDNVVAVDDVKLEMEGEEVDDDDEGEEVEAEQGETGECATTAIANDSEGIHEKEKKRKEEAVEGKGEEEKETEALQASHEQDGGKVGKTGDGTRNGDGVDLSEIKDEGDAVEGVRTQSEDDNEASKENASEGGRDDGASATLAVAGPTHNTATAGIGDNGPAIVVESPVNTPGPVGGEKGDKGDGDGDGEEEGDDGFRGSPTALKDLEGPISKTVGTVLFPGLDGQAMFNATSAPIRDGDDGDYAEDLLEANLRVDNPLSKLFDECVIRPVRDQYQLVNVVGMRMFFQEIRILNHFAVLRDYVLTNAGDFMDELSTSLFSSLEKGQLVDWGLKNILDASLKATERDMSDLVDNLSLVVNPDVSSTTNDPLNLRSIEWKYSAEFPLNIIIHSDVMAKYNRVFVFMLQMKRVTEVLKDMWSVFQSKWTRQDAKYHPKLLGVQMFRHEIQHFVSIMQGYLISQVIEVTWQEFCEKLESDVHDLEGLCEVHEEYLDKAIQRCLLNDKAASVMSIIQSIFSIIINFGQLVAKEDPTNLSDTLFASIAKCATVFRHHTRFLFTVLTKLAARGYQPHLQDLLIRLNFNDYFDRQMDSSQ